MITISMVSTPLHLFMATNIACSQPNDEHHLIFIDQKESLAKVYLSAVKAWELSPFSNVEIFYASGRSPFKKLTHRKALFFDLKKLITRLSPDEIRVGNDRRIEFQYVMHVAHNINPCVQGAYLDEGTYTYIGREASKSIGDKYVDNFVKKLVYGFWWDNPKTVGASNWVNIVYAAFPDMIFHELKSKKILQIDSKLFSDSAIKELSVLLCSSENLSSKEVHDLDVIIFLPHESLYEQESIRLAWVDLIKTLSSESHKIGVKYHPRYTIDDPLDITSLDKVTLIPPKVNFESLVFLISKSVLVGDVSSVLLLSRWLRPELPVVSVINSVSTADHFVDLYRKLDIPMLGSKDAISFISEIAEKS